ncbi:hypothetical protein ABH935_007010 [Catenulispora sp. GAS73]|uniref:hypothetical protein n=1 Tax=Catenulispora sp. GAS73 TaxID=3156269 RepID=UPI003516CA9C
MTGHDTGDDFQRGPQLPDLQARLEQAQALGFHLDPARPADPFENVTQLAGAVAAYTDALSQYSELFEHPGFLAHCADGYSWALSQLLPAALIRPALTFRLNVLCRVLQPAELAAADPFTGAAVAAMRAGIEILAASVTSGTGYSLQRLNVAAAHHADAGNHLIAALARAAP